MITDFSLVPSDSFSQSDLRLFEAKLFELFKRRFSSYTMHESSSLPEETAQALLNSVVFTLNEGLEKSKQPAATLLTSDLEPIFFEGVAQLEKKVKLETQLFIRVCNSLPPLKNCALSESVKSISGFKHKYQHRYFACDIPCEIMYPLCVQPPETLHGVNYVLSWLQSLEAENKIINSFNLQEVESLLKKSYQNYVLMPLNLCEPVLLNTLARAFAGESPAELNVTDETRKKIACDFSHGGKLNVFESVAKAAAQTLCESLNLGSRFLRGYVTDFALGIRPRLEAAIENQALDNVFISF